jgi:hypothetical protein
MKRYIYPILIYLFLTITMIATKREYPIISNFVGIFTLVCISADILIFTVLNIIRNIYND